MSVLITNIRAGSSFWIKGMIKPVISTRGIFRAANLLQVADSRSEIEKLKKEYSEPISNVLQQTSHINIDRSVKIPVETSIRYMKSEAYKITYEDKLIWELYRRNFKGQFTPTKTRKTCIRAGKVSTGNPCPICRDEYLVLDYRNTELLKQFISPHNGATLSHKVTHICQRQYKHLLVAIKKARDYGTITYDPPHRIYNYSDWYKPESQN